MLPCYRLALVGLVIFAGCQKKPAAQDNGGTTNARAAAPEVSAAPLVGAAERSAHFAAVSRQLELGGTVYGYYDVDGDPLKLAAGLNRLAEQIAVAQPMAAAFVKQDYAQLLIELGANDIKAIGFSSVHAAQGGFRNRVFFYTPNGRHGLWNGLGGPAATFVYPKLAPSDTDFYAESELDAGAVYAAVKAVVAKVGGDTTANAFEAQLKTAGEQAGVSILEVIQSLKGRVVTVLRFDPEKNVTVTLGSPVKVPAFSFLLRIDGVGTALTAAIEKSGAFEASDDGARRVYTLKQPSGVEGLQPAITVESGALCVASSREFLRECIERKTGGLDQNPEFQKGLADLGGQGNGLAYVNPRLFARLRGLSAANPDLPPQARPMVDLFIGQLPEITEPLMAERINLPEGVLVRSHWHRSLKQDLAAVMVYNPVTIGMMAAMAIPAFEKVRMASQQNAQQARLADEQKARLAALAAAQKVQRQAANEKFIRVQLTRLATLAAKYRQEHNVEVVNYADLVGPGKAISSIRPVAGEDYSGLVFKPGVPVSVRTAEGHVIEIKP